MIQSKIDKLLEANNQLSDENYEREYGETPLNWLWAFVIEQ